MADIPTRRDYFEAGRRAILSANAPRINPKVVDIDGSDVNLIVNAGALMGEELSRAFSQCISGLFVGTAREDRLDRLIMDRTGGLLPRKDASPATCTLTISRPTSSAGDGVIPAGTRAQTPSGVTFATDIDVTFAALDLTQDVPATCTQTGTIGRVAAGLVNRFVDQPFDTTMVVTSTAGAGGSPQEDDVRYAARYFGFFVSIRRGILPAIQQAALAVAGVEVAAAAEIVNPGSGLPAGAVQLIVGDSDGTASPTMLQSVRDNLLTYRAAGIPVFVQGGAVVFETVSWRLAYLSGIDSVNARNQVRAVTVAVAQFLNPNETLYRASLIAGARAVPGAVVSTDSLVTPVGDIVPATAYGNDHTMIRIRPEDVSFL